MFKKLLTAGLTEFSNSIFSGIDSLITSDEERGKIKSAQARIEASAMEVAGKLEAELDKQITERHKNDMASDSWLSKNIRPLAIVFLSVGCVLFAFCSVFCKITLEQMETAKSFAVPLFSLTGTAFTFYFGGRSYEKGQSIKGKKS